MTQEELDNQKINEIMEQEIVFQLCREYRELQDQLEADKDNEEIIDRLCEIEEALAWLDP